ncbi:hypothetical protein [Actinoplanes derwentensis]|uniref:Uncharacterized protein n=1 Tax=Actinoplanes derwentensis TaxID=113562 RepID=A0A1H1SCW2_9ACTN|nr:hypothetical protein [Actinoplanes derwentensis]GID83335.1 hypothetical protein Ade03nite_22590 [Actinoplanes derwentensis]SDS45713.1 hypothetical protein SAMN04489716_0826 [Actinoplanes derwentensis]
MSRSKKRLAVIGAGVGTAALVVGGVAFAAFNQIAVASPTGTTSAESFAPLTVSGEWLGRPAPNGTYPTDGSNLRLLPGEAGDVKISLTNPSSNTVQGKVLYIKPVAPTAADDVCNSAFEVATYTPGASNPVVVKNGLSIVVTLRKAVTLKSSATETCQGKTYPTKFEVKFEATRDAVTGSTASFNPDTTPTTTTTP